MFSVHIRSQLLKHTDWFMGLYSKERIVWEQRGDHLSWQRLYLHLSGKLWKYSNYQKKRFLSCFLPRTLKWNTSSIRSARMIDHTQVMKPGLFFCAFHYDYLIAFQESSRTIWTYDICINFMTNDCVFPSSATWKPIRVWEWNQSENKHRIGYCKWYYQSEWW